MWYSILCDWNGTMDDERYMQFALEQARAAYRIGEVPIGAVIISGGEVFACGHNLRETTDDPTAHAEVIAIRRAAERLGHWRLSGMTLYVTIEPCPMCAGSLVNARVDRLVYGAADPKAGAAGTLMNLLQDERLNHRVSVTGGILEAECAELMRQFFQERRHQSPTK